jgi:hypothetical protein
MKHNTKIAALAFASIALMPALDAETKPLKA